MHIRDLFRIYKPLFSIELFPPKTDEGVRNLKNKLWEIRTFAPEYISVTYGAGGGTRSNTLEICRYIKQKLGTECMPHLTCVAHSQDEISGILADFRAARLENIVALRGDPPQGADHFEPPPNGFRYAQDLVRRIRELDQFGIAVAGYPEGHVDAPSYEADLERQIEKINAGADLIISQFFLDNDDFLRWRDDLRKRGVTVPIEAGILPVISAQQITKFAGMCGAKIPRPLLDKLESYGDDKESASKYGVEYAVGQVERLLAEDIDGVHLYALNRLEPIRAIEPLLRARQKVADAHVVS